MFREEDLEVGQKFRNYYESSKFEAEKYVRSDCVVPYLVFRPSIIMGDAYEGKAEGCTFGYYRFAYIFFIFKNWLIDRMANGSSITKKILSMSGTSYDMKSDLITIPWLVIPYTTHGTVDMVSIDYVLDSMLKGVDNINVQKLTIHLTNPNPPAFKWAASCLVQDLGYRKVKYFKVAPVFLVILLKTLYHVFYPLKIKTRSAMWYLPYITRNYFFSHKNSKAFEIPEQKLIGRDFLEKINTYAKKEIFKKIVYDK